MTQEEQAKQNFRKNKSVNLFIKNQTKPFVAGHRNRVNYAGRVFDEKEMVNLV